MPWQDRVNTWQISEVKTSSKTAVCAVTVCKLLSNISIQCSKNDFPERIKVGNLNQDFDLSTIEMERKTTITFRKNIIFFSFLF